MTDQLLRYADFAVGEDRVYKDGEDTDFMETGPNIVCMNGVYYYYPEVENNERYEWTDQTYLSKLVIADAIMQSEKWPESWVVDPLGKLIYCFKKGAVIKEVIGDDKTYIDAVLAAVEEL